MIGRLQNELVKRQGQLHEQDEKLAAEMQKAHSLVDQVSRMWKHVSCSHLAEEHQLLCCNSI